MTKPEEQKIDKKPTEFEQKILHTSRVARVTAGGKRFSFRVVLALGDRNGRVGVGVKKGKDVQFAVEKATRDAKKNIITVPITATESIPHESYGKFSSSVVFLKSAAEGRGIIAGGAVRTVCDLAGYRNIVGKIISRSGNKLNVARAAIEALKKLKIKSEKLKVKNGDADTSTASNAETKKA